MSRDATYLAAFVAFLAAVLVSAAISANEGITRDRHAALLACVEAGADPLACREGLQR